MLECMHAHISNTQKLNMQLQEATYEYESKLQLQQPQVQPKEQFNELQLQILRCIKGFDEHRNGCPLRTICNNTNNSWDTIEAETTALVEDNVIYHCLNEKHFKIVDQFKHY